MVKVIMGVKGSGKTKEMVRLVNEAIKVEHGNVVCIEHGPNMTFDIDYRARLIDFTSLPVKKTFDQLKGFICGLYAGNFDITHIFIDSLYKIAAANTPEETDEFLKFCDDFSTAHGVNFTMTISADVANASETMKKFF
ncbi:MAG: hypothetical protein IJP23_00565 [Oscillospiraceae bacterium]|nr:hypothetical protein [Oscillospiraceae bacterium]